MPFLELTFCIVKSSSSIVEEIPVIAPPINSSKMLEWIAIEDSERIITPSVITELCINFESTWLPVVRHLKNSVQNDLHRYDLKPNKTGP